MDRQAPYPDFELRDGPLLLDQESHELGIDAVFFWIAPNTGLTN